ncbi:MAG TPA: LemA family protein [Acidimicrobiales bacterium]|nr:LemA family protein [Acidimicrobiales bacterium]
MAVVFVVLAVVVLAGLYFVFQYNGLVKLRNRIEAAWSQIDVQLQRRYDLVPNLVETVKGYAAHEKQVFERVTTARTAAIDAKGVAEQAKAESGFTTALKSLFAVSEAYPELKANENFLALQEELTGTEGRIAYARQYYNDIVQSYNSRVQSFPSNLVANAFHFTQREYFEADDSSRPPVQVKF